MGFFSKQDWVNIKGWFVKNDNRNEFAPSESLKASTKDSIQRRGITRRLKLTYKYRANLLLKNWRNAIAAAEDPYHPTRWELYSLYNSVVEDDHYTNQIRTARFTVSLGDFIIEKDGNPSEELKGLLKKSWFIKFLHHAVDTEFWGHTLLEFQPMKMNETEFQKLQCIPREHVSPERGEILINPSDLKGIPYRKGVLSKHLIEMGEPDDLGLLKEISLPVIRKSYNETDWDKRNERYGIPLLAIKTHSRQKEELDAKEEMAANFGSNGYVILDDGDEVDIIESNQAFTYKTFQDRIKGLENAIAKLVNGQTGTSEEKAYVGSSEVHERILNAYTLARMVSIENFINTDFFPFLIKHGYPLENAEFKFLDVIEASQKKSKNDETPLDNEKEGEKKKQSSKQLTVRSLQFAACEQFYKLATGSCQLSTEQLTFDLDKIVKKSIKNVFEKKLKRGDLDAETWAANVEQLWEGLQQGAGKQLIEIAYTDTDYELLAQFKTNIQVFAAFKNHVEISDMVDALMDGNRLREWNEFKKIANQISTNYNQLWLQAEYQTAVASGQMATKWNDFQRNKDILPMLHYRTQADDKVRPDHEMLEGVIMPIDDSFWDKYFPPNGWRCRCFVQQVAGERKEPEIFPNDETGVPPAFHHNVGKTKELYGQDHPYFTQATLKRPDQKVRLIKAVSHLIYKNYDKGWRKQYFNKATGGYVVSHKNSIQHELRQNVRIGKQLAYNGDAIELIADRPNEKSPDALINGRLWEFKTIKGNVKNGVQSAIKRGKQQSARVLLELPNQFKVRDLILGLHNAVVLHDKKEKVQEVILLFSDGKVVRLNREEIINGKFTNQI